MKRYVVLEIDCTEEIEAHVDWIEESKEEAIEDILNYASTCKRDYGDIFECKKETSGDFDYSFWYTNDGIKECESLYKIIEIEF